MIRFSNWAVFTVSFFVLTMYACKNEIKSPTDTQQSQGTQEVKETYGTGETSRIYTRIDGKIEGKMTDYYVTGELKGEKNFKNNKQDGKTTIYYESGKIKEVQYYINGLRNGGDTIFYEDGKLKFVTEFKDNIKNGYLRKWDDAGGLIYEAKFAMDTLIEVNGKVVKQEMIAK